jgi:dTDP-4-dehydrorhamnose reductase
VDERHPLWDWLLGCGACERQLARLCEDPCPPDVIGINAYVTSERFLDERLELYPPELHGGNGRQAYVDVETVRAHGAPIDGFAGRLREAHARYGLPLAITEVHMGCTREEQMRWLQQAWRDAVQARADGIDVRGVTAWAAFGTVDWNSLLTREAGHYEPGLWDVRSDPPRRTALGALAASLTRGERHGVDEPHPVLAGPGWWQRDLRHAFPPHGAVHALPARGRPLLIVGGGALARAFARLSHMRGLPYELLDSAILLDEARIVQALEEAAAWAVVDAGQDEDVDAAERDPSHWRVHAQAPALLARACGHAGVRLLTFSSDHVFPGRDHLHYLERDAVRPVNAHGRAKAHLEREACKAGALVIRSAGVFGPWDGANFVARGVAALRAGQPWLAAHDQVLSPTYAPDLVQAALDLLIDGEQGLWHLTNGEALSWADLACRAAEHARLDVGRVRRAPGRALGQVASRPRWSALGSERGVLLPSLDDALARFQHDHELVPSEPPPLRAG